VPVIREVANEVKVEKIVNYNREVPVIKEVMHEVKVERQIPVNREKAVIKEVINEVPVNKTINVTHEVANVKQNMVTKSVDHVINVTKQVANIQERVVEKPVLTEVMVEKMVPVKKEIFVENEVLDLKQTIVNKPVMREITLTREVPQIQERHIEKNVPVLQERIVERPVVRDVLVEKFVDRPAEKIGAEAELVFVKRTEPVVHTFVENAADMELRQKSTRKEVVAGRDMPNISDAKVTETKIVTTTTTTTTNSGSKTEIKSDGIKRDDLSRIFGVRYWVVEYLNQNGIYTYRHLMEAGVPRLRELMAKGGVRYSTLNPDSWVKQANFAMRGDWDSMKQWQRDDLKLIEGIGPKIEQLFNDAGIVTFEQLAAMPVEKMQAILTAAGPRYSIHDPKTWARQGQMAADGKWEELKSWQQVLDGGKE
jgi:predicted flap endonuclease-1-like 5' DNA nuclease